MRRTAAIAVGLLAPALIAVSAHAEPYTAELVQTPTYLVCAGSTRLAQANAVVDRSNAVGWDSVPPTQSFQNGAGCASAESFPAGGGPADAAVLDFPMAGTFTGNLTAMTVRLHTVDTTARAVESQSLVVEVIVNGRTRVNQVEIDASSVRWLHGAGGYIEFSVTNIGLLSELDRDKTHAVEVRVGTRHPDIGTVNNWVWDATEFPSGITFNPVRTSPTRIKASA